MAAAYLEPVSCAAAAFHSECHNSMLSYAEQAGMAASQGLTSVNKRLAGVAGRDSAVTYLDCGRPFFASPTELNHTLLPDALHPSAAGNSSLK